MTLTTPRFYEKWEGQIIKLIIINDGPVFFDTLLQKTGLTAYALRDALHNLFFCNIIAKDEGNNSYNLIDEGIRNEWKSFLKGPSTEESAPKEKPHHNLPEEKNDDPPTPKGGNGFIKWIEQWQEIRNLSLPLENKHFFLEGEYLDELSRVLIGQAQEEILVTNPYIDSCHLTKELLHASEKKIKVKVVSRKPTLDDETKRKCQSEMLKAGMFIHYDSQIHSKLIVIDGKVAIVSSMNFYSQSSGGFTKEAGIVSLDEKVVKSVADYISNLLEKIE
jgi:phosphatidylserine/phosphatidylglycerophosphate/cardiolipin synthase-like enzyme